MVFQWSGFFVNLFFCHDHQTLYLNCTRLFLILFLYSIKVSLVLVLRSWLIIPIVSGVLIFISSMGSQLNKKSSLTPILRSNRYYHFYEIISGLYMAMHKFLHLARPINWLDHANSNPILT